MNYNHTKNCRYCNKKFHSQRADAKFCSSTCRVHFRQNKSNNIASCKTDENEFLNVLNISKNVLKQLLNNFNLDTDDINELFKNKPDLLKSFLLSHEAEINKLIYELNLFSEEEYASLSIFTEKVMNLLDKLQDSPEKINMFMPEIMRLTSEYENL